MSVSALYVTFNFKIPSIKLLTSYLYKIFSSVILISVSQLNYVFQTALKSNAVASALLPNTVHSDKAQSVAGSNTALCSAVSAGLVPGVF